MLGQTVSSEGRCYALSLVLFLPRNLHNVVLDKVVALLNRGCFPRNELVQRRHVHSLEDLHAHRDGTLSNVPQVPGDCIHARQLSAVAQPASPTAGRTA